MTGSKEGSIESNFELDKASELRDPTSLSGVIVSKLIELTEAGLLFWRMVDSTDTNYIATVKRISFILDIDTRVLWIKRPLFEPARDVPSRDEIIEYFTIWEGTRDIIQTVLESWGSCREKELHSVIGVLDTVPPVRP